MRGVAIGGDPAARVHMHKSGPNILLCLASGAKVRLAYVMPARALQLRDRIQAFVLGEQDQRNAP